ANLKPRLAIPALRGLKHAEIIEELFFRVFLQGTSAFLMVYYSAFGQDTSLWWAIPLALVNANFLQAVIFAGAHIGDDAIVGFSNRLTTALYLGILWWLAPLFGKRAIRLHQLNNHLLDLDRRAFFLSSRDREFDRQLTSFEHWLVGHFTWNIATISDLSQFE